VTRETSNTADSPTLHRDTKAEPQSRSVTERERARMNYQPQVLSKSFQSPKPVQIYWFFGGR
jgi:hypothetical protein